jgi:hypothetical protein
MSESTKIREDWIADYRQVAGQECFVEFAAQKSEDGWVQMVVPATVVRQMFGPFIDPTPEIKKEIAERVMQYALDHYNDGGWDVLVECYEISGVIDLLWENPFHAGADVLTFEDAIEELRTGIIEIWDEKEADARISAGEGGGW